MATAHFNYYNQNITETVCTDQRIEKIKKGVIEYINSTQDFSQFEGQFLFDFYGDKIWFTYIGNDVKEANILLPIARKLNEKIDSLKET